ncbi:MAG: succinate dehydrogenase iron-sulfur subunit [Planctomycetes bacterium]|nr:succinate dehydrogenase iron-sulfur subunit [Planctomycetota bacterium]
MANLTFRVFRFDPDSGEKPRFQDFRVPSDRKSLTVLDGLFHIQGRLDGSLAFRSSCRAAVCGSCAMHINGKFRLACKTLVASLGRRVITIRPLAHLPILRDLVVDLAPLWEKYELIKPYLMPGKPPPAAEIPQTPHDRDRLDGFYDCILCACCHASCPMTGTGGKYLGPAALLQAARFVLDSRDGAFEERLALVNSDGGVWRCHTVANCQEVCPKSLDPTGAIAILKTRLLKQKLGSAAK